MSLDKSTYTIDVCQILLVDILSTYQHKKSISRKKVILLLWEIIRFQFRLRQESSMISKEQTERLTEKTPAAT